MIGADNALDLLSTVVVESAADTDAMDALLSATERHFVRFGCSTVLQSSSTRDPKVTFRAVVAGRVAEASTSDLGLSGLRAARDRAVALARAASSALAAPPELPAKDGCAEVIDVRGAYDPETAALSTTAAAGPLGRAFQRADRDHVTLAGRHVTGSRERALVNSLGLRRYFRSTVADVKIFATDQRASGYCGNVATSASSLDLDRYVESAVQKCVGSRDAVSLAAGRYDVILEPEAVAELLEWLSMIGFTPRSLEDGTSFLHGRLGTAVTGDRVTIYDDGWCESGVGLPAPFDREGVLKRKVVLIEDGIGRQVVHDSASARRMGCQSTGHSVSRDEGSDSGVSPGNLVFAAGADSVDDLLSRVERGLWVTSFHYVNGLLDPRRAVMTGLTRHGTFQIEDGRLARGVENLRFTDSILEAFGRIDGVSRAVQAIPTWWSYLGANVAPTLLIRGLAFTGQTTE